MGLTGAIDEPGGTPTQTGLAKTHVGEILTNPIYVGRLRTGEPAGIAPLIEPALYSRVQTARERRRTRTPGRIVKRNYALRLRCTGCRRFLYGDVGRYRHPAPTCAAFRTATPLIRRRRRNLHDTRIKGHSYPQAWYEDAVGAIFAQIGRVDDATITEVVRLHDSYRPQADELTLARIGRARDDAARQLAKTCDLPAWQATMGRLDAEEALALEPVETRRRVTNHVTMAPDSVSLRVDDCELRRGTEGEARWPEDTKREPSACGRPQTGFELAAEGTHSLAVDDPVVGAGVAWITVGLAGGASV